MRAAGQRNGQAECTVELDRRRDVTGRAQSEIRIAALDRAVNDPE
jgi:hypothetical protein